MKRYIIFMLIAAFAASACQEKELSPREKLDSLPRTQLEVSYSVSGQDISALNWSSSPRVQEIDVTINDDNLRWNLESNREWCKVREGEHRGSGKVVLEIAGNEDFDPREEATLTFVAGDFRGYRIKANQSAAAFIVGQPFFISGNGSQQFSVNVTTVEGTQWTVSSDSWITVEAPGPGNSTDGFTTTQLNFTVQENSSPTRYGAITLSSGSETGAIHVSQFGSDLQYDSETGDIFFPKGKPAVLSFLAPKYTISSIDVPSFASVVIDNGDDNSETAAVTITFEDNLSDCSEMRSADISLHLSNVSASIVSLPTVQQDYTAANGLLTGPGLVRFAQAVNAGESTADWEKNGKVVLLQDIDMNGIEGWTGIGTEEHPFSGTIDGGGFAVYNLKKASSGIFNIVKDATISNLALGKGSVIYNAASFPSRACLGGIANRATGTTFSNCTLIGSIEMAGSSDSESGIYAGGIVGWCDASSKITSCKNSGNAIISTTNSGESVGYLGGMVGTTDGEVSNCEMSGSLKQSSALGMVRVGGIMGLVTSATKISVNAFLGDITVAGNAVNLDIGGLYGLLSDGSLTMDNANDKSLSMGTITLTKYQSGADTRVYAGGILGRAAGGTTININGYTLQTNIEIAEAGAITSWVLATGGALGGCDFSEPASSVTLTGLVNQGATSIQWTASTKSQSRHGYLGGIAGFLKGPATIKDCTNEATIGKAGNNNDTSSNDFFKMVGGIVAGGDGGDMSFDNCINKGVLYNGHYSNRRPKTVYQGYYITMGTAGIIGAFEYTPSASTNKLTITNCTNLTVVGAYRGYTAGMVCYAKNATITGCSSRGDMGQYNASHKGGIASALEGDCTISNCEVKCSIHSLSQGGATGSPGGILSIDLNGDETGNLASGVTTGVTIENCSYFGTLDGAGTPTNGGIVGVATNNTVIRNCKFGGVQQGADVSENNVEGLVTGNGKGQISGITYWNGS